MRILLPEEAAELLKVPKSFIYERTRDRCPAELRIPHRKLGGRYIRIVESELLTWFENNGKSGKLSGPLSHAKKGREQ